MELSIVCRKLYRYTVAEYILFHQNPSGKEYITCGPCARVGNCLSAAGHDVQILAILEINYQTHNEHEG